ncbi:MAG: hypothetical protein HUU26_00040 [Gemmatimonadaceae bacterium]|nr:hypothetical protein [Gemmatimonadaceae bacterium]
MTLSHPGYRLAAIPALLVAGLAASPAARPVVDGWSFTSTTKSTDRSVGETTMQVRLAGANVRVDWVKAPQGMPRDGYMLLNADSAILKMVSPREKTVTILPVGGMASMLGAIGAAGMMKMEVSDVVVSVSDDGAGEDLLGYRTRKYTMKQAYGLKMSVGPIKRSQTIDNTTELWVADVPAPEQKAFEAFAKNFAQSLTGAGFGGDGMKALLAEEHQHHDHRGEGVQAGPHRGVGLRDPRRLQGQRHDVDDEQVRSQLSLLHPGAQPPEAALRECAQECRCRLGSTGFGTPAFAAARGGSAPRPVLPGGRRAARHPLSSCAAADESVR